MWKWLVAVAVLVAAAGWYVTAPARVEPDELGSRAADLANGERLFHAGGCASCHAAPKSEGEARLVLGGGLRLATPFGTFAAPNISPDPAAGIGSWTEADFVSALRFGTSPDGRHYYPAFPYTSYTRMTLDDIRDLWAYLRTLPPSPRANEEHALQFPFSIRRGIGLWKRLFMSDAPVLTTAGLPDEVLRGRYLAEGPGHCGECHTPRNAFGGLRTAAWLMGAENPSAEGKVPGINAVRLSWSAAEIAYYLETGFTPDFDSAGGQMAEVVRNMARLPAADRAAIAAYLKAVR